MVERGVSLARSLFAFNSVNVEGWALYAEVRDDAVRAAGGQFIALQFRLMRAARALLDPMLNLGLIDRERAHEVLVHEVVGLSEPMARQETRPLHASTRPARPPRYFYGYTRLLQLRLQNRATLGAAFDRKAFNDFVIDQGLLPPDLLAEAVRTRFIPSQQRRRVDSIVHERRAPKTPLRAHKCVPRPTASPPGASGIT